MMNKEQATKLETRKAYLGERTDELDSLHAKMKALNDRINLIKQQQNFQPNQTSQDSNIIAQNQISTNSQPQQMKMQSYSSSPSESLLSSANSSSRNQFAPVRRFDSRPNPSLIAQVHPMRNVPQKPSNTNTPSPNSSDKASPRDDKYSSSPRNNFMTPQNAQHQLVPSLQPSGQRFSPSYSGSPNTSIISDSPSISPSSSAIRNVNNSLVTPKSRTDSPSDYTLKLAKVRPVQHSESDSSDASTIRDPNFTSSRKDPKFPLSVGDKGFKYSPEAKTPSPNYQALKTPYPMPTSESRNKVEVKQVYQTSESNLGRGNITPLNKNATTRGSNSDQSKSSGYVTSEDPNGGAGSDDIIENQLSVLNEEKDSPVIHQYPILQQYVLKNNDNNSYSLAGSNMRPSAYERLFPLPSSSANEKQEGTNVLENSKRSPEEDEDLDVSKSSSNIHIDKTTGHKQIRRRSSLVHGDENGSSALFKSM